MVPDILFVIVIIFSVILHEVAHGYTANSLGDTTAKDAGRLTLNPIPHIDMIGTIIVPAALVLLSTGFVFGWAKPVPYNPYNLRGRFGELLVAAAGPLTNVGIALLFALAFHLTLNSVPAAITELFVLAVFVNLFLAVLNLLPIPPLDGAKICSSLLSAKQRLALEDKVASVVNVNSIFFMIIVLLFIVFVVLDHLVTFTKFLSFILLGG